ncbi:MAG: hypothetical protein ACLGPM_11495 [Acidobacteriota bacterium]
MVSPQRPFSHDPPPRLRADARRRRPGPRFRWWWLWIVFIAIAIFWYLGYNWDHQTRWLQRHFTNPSTTRPIVHPQSGSTAPAAGTEHEGPLGRGEASQTGNGQGQSTGRLGTQSKANANAEAGHAAGPPPRH